MTDKEKREAYGGAMLDLRDVKVELAAAQKRLSQWIETARTVIASVENFSQDPLRRAPDQRPVADYAFGWNSQLRSQELPDLVHDLFAIANKAQKLQAQVDAFEK